MGVAASGDVEDVTVEEAKSGTASSAAEPGAGKSGTEGGKAGTEGGKAETGEEAATGPGGTPGPTGDIRNTPEFKQMQEEGKRVEAMLAGATPAQKKLIAELVQRHPEHLLPVPNEAFTRKWLNATAGIRDEQVAKLADAGWTPGTDIDEAEFKRRVDEVIAGKASTGELWTSPEPPPTPPKKPVTKDPKSVAKGDYKAMIDAKIKKEKAKPEQVHEELAKIAKGYDFKSQPAEVRVQWDEKGAAQQTTLAYYREWESVALVVVKVRREKGKVLAKIVYIYDAVHTDGQSVDLPLDVGEWEGRLEH
jgi:hypothetical protein